MTPTNYVLTLMRTLCVLLWTGAAFALPAVVTSAHFGPLLTDPLVLIVSALISFAMAVTTLYMRLNALFAAMEPDQPKPLVRPLAFAIAHVGGSIMAGGAGLLLASQRGLEADSALLCVLVMSFMGAKGLEILAERWMPITRLLPEGKT